MILLIMIHWHQADEFLAMIGKTEIVFHNPLHLQDDEFLYQYR